MKPTNNNGSIIVRFTKFRNKYSLTNLGKFDDPVAMSKASQICLAIDQDINLGRFTATNNTELFKAYHPLAELSKHHIDSAMAIDCIQSVEIALLNKDLRDRNLHNTRNFLRRYGKPIKSKEQALQFWQWLQGESKGNNRTINRHLESLKPICSHFRDIPKLKTTQSENEKPFTKNEIKSIIATVDTHFPHYSSFIKFLFSTGCRPNEATALTWDCVDFEAKTITIKKALAIAKDGTKRTKKTKTGIDRVIPISNQVYILLKYQASAYADHAFTDLVFPSSKLTYIDLGNFRSRVWTKALQLANVPYRTVYNTRHTFCSHFLNETPDFVKLCSITHGSKSGIATLQKHYAHIVDKPVMPEMF